MTITIMFVVIVVLVVLNVQSGLALEEEKKRHHLTKISLSMHRETVSIHEKDLAGVIVTGKQKTPCQN